MKAISILKPLEFSLETKEETWTQGVTIHGLLKIKNLESKDFELSDYKMALGYADIKKVHAKAQGCFKISQQIELSNQIIKGNALAEFPFEFKLDPNVTVSDKKASFHLLYGKVDAPFHLQISILPQLLFLEITKLLDTFFRFKVKEYKGTAKGIDFIFIPPTSREYATVESLTLSLAMKEQDLMLDFHFIIKKLDLTGLAGVTNKVLKETKSIEKTLTPKEYLMGKGFLDQDKLLKAFELILGEVKRKEFFT